MPSMARNDQVYSGMLGIGDQEVWCEVWIQGTAAAVFERPANKVALTLSDISLTINDDDKLVLAGTDVDTGEHVEAIALTAEQTLARWDNARIVWPDNSVWSKATVIATNYRVTAKLKGEVRTLVGAKAVVAGNSGTVFDPLGSNVTLTIVRPAGCVPCGAKS